MYVVEETNTYAKYCREVLKRPFAKMWKGCNMEDLAHYIGLSMLMGVHRFPSIRMYWSSSPVFGHKLFPQIMTSKKFIQIGKYLHTFNKLAVPQNNDDKLILVRPIMEYLQEKCKHWYTPEQNLSLDEGIMPYKGRLIIKTYNPMKPNKYGVKIYFL